MGWASGFRAGSDVARQAIDTYRQAELQRGIEAAQNLKPEEIRAPGATQSQVDAANAETSALAAQDAQEFGLQVPRQYRQAEVGQATAPSKYRLGNQVLDTAPSEQQVAMARRRGMVDAVTRFDPTRGMELGLRLDQADREAEKFGWERDAQPLRQKALQQQTRTGEIALGQSERALQVQGLTDEVMKMPIEALKAYAAKLNTNESNLPFLMVGEGKGGYKFLTIDPKSGRPMGQEFTLNEGQLRELAAASVLGMSGYGQESMAKLSSVNKEIADLVTQMNATTAQVVGSQNQANQLATGDRQRQQQIDQQGAYQQGMLDLRAGQGQNRNEAIEFGNKIDGVLEGYQAAMAAGPAGRQAAAIYAQEYDQLRGVASQLGLKVPPALAALTAAQRQGSGKPVKVEDAGQRYMIDGQLRVSDGRGGYIAENGFLPEERGVVLAKAGVPQQLIPNVVWSNDGTTVMFRGMEFDPRNPQDMRQLRARASQLGANDMAVDEAQRATPGSAPNRDWSFGPKITYGPAPGAPSIYAGEEAWREYRGLQQGR